MRSVEIIRTGGEANKVWEHLDGIHTRKDYGRGYNSIYVDSKEKFQTILGFGGAFTEATAHTWSISDEKCRKEIVEAYFDREKGLGYNLGRTTIGGCDFSLEPYTYIQEGDDELSTFSIKRDKGAIIPMIKKAEETAGHPIELMCSPWSPPAFMKDNDDINHGGKLLKKYYKTWAQYMVRYILEMKKQGMNITMVSVQNEPLAKQIWASCKYDALEEAEMAVDYLYPELEAAGLSDQVRVLVWDHNRDVAFNRMDEIMSYPGAKDIIWGMGYHWYVSDKSGILKMVHKKFPKQHIIFTEGCVELAQHTGSTSSTEEIGAWKHGEIYGRNMINDFNNYNEAWIDWNLLLNEEGGPNYVGNFCEAPVIYDRETGEVRYNSSYYYIGHFSRYVQAGAKRVGCYNDIECSVYSVAFENPNGDIIVVTQNEKESSQDISLIIDDEGVNISLPAHSITTFVIKNK